MVKDMVLLGKYLVLVLHVIFWLLRSNSEHVWYYTVSGTCSLCEKPATET